MPKRKGNNSQHFHAALATLRKSIGVSDFTDEMLDELAASGALERLAKRKVNVLKLCELIDDIPSVFVEPVSHGVTHIQRPDEEEVRDHAKSLLSASAKLIKLLDATSRIRFENSVSTPVKAKLNNRMPYSLLIPLGAGVSHIDVKMMLSVYVQKIETWLAAGHHLDNFISNFPELKLRSEFPKRNQIVFDLIQMIELRLGKGNDPLVTDLYNAKPMQTLLGISRELSHDTVKTMRKKLRLKGSRKET